MAKARKRTDSPSGVDTPSQRHADEPPFTDPGADGGATGDHRDRIAMRAYELFLARGGSDGGDFDDWLAAEREVAGGNGNGSRGDAGE
jgi:hypothetical protein